MNARQVRALAWAVDRAQYAEDVIPSDYAKVMLARAALAQARRELRERTADLRAAKKTERKALQTVSCRGVGRLGACVDD